MILDTTKAFTALVKGKLQRHVVATDALDFLQKIATANKCTHEDLKESYLLGGYCDDSTFLQWLSSALNAINTTSDPVEFRRMPSIQEANDILNLFVKIGLVEVLKPF